jgi:excisionase family DNA binding protein
MNNVNNVSVAINNNIEAEDAAKILGCSYPHIINLIHQKKLKAQKLGKKWLVDAADVQRAKATHLVTPRPRKNKQLKLLNGEPNIELGPDEVEIRIKMSKAKYQLLDLALKGKDQKNLKEHLESKVEELHAKIQKHFESVAF